MPRRDPLSPPLLALAGVLAAFPAAWLALAADAGIAGAAGSLAGFSWAGVSLTPSFLPAPGLQLSGSHPPTSWVIALLAGPVGSVCSGLAFLLVMQAFRGLAWLRVVALQWVVFAALRIPAELVAGVVPGGRGPVDDLYRQLGDPESGRWAVALLAVLVLAGMAALAARLAVGTGRAWMRADGRGFRRRLVRVVAAYPALASLGAWSALAAWGGRGFMALWLVLTFAALQLVTP